MADQLTPFALGKDLITITVGELSIASDGTASLGSTINLLAYINAIDPSLDIEAEELSPLWATQMNMVPIREGSSLTLSVLARSDAANELTTMLNTASTLQKRYRITCEAAAEAWSGDYTFLGWGHPIQGHGGQLITARFGPVNLGNTRQVSYG